MFPVDGARGLTNLHKTGNCLGGDTGLWDLELGVGMEMSLAHGAQCSEHRGWLGRPYFGESNK